MQFYLMTRTYDSYGSHTTLCLIPDFLLTDVDDHQGFSSSPGTSRWTSRTASPLECRIGTQP
jgi:hypothetical protein